MNEINPMLAMVQHVFKALEPRDMPLPDDNYVCDHGHHDRCRECWVEDDRPEIG